VPKKDEGEFADREPASPNKIAAAGAAEQYKREGMRF